MRARVCLVTSEHLSTNPRLVKEADALSTAGYTVRVVACQWQEWATRADTSLLATRPWPCQYIDWSRQRQARLFWYSRLRQHTVRRFLAPLTLGYGIAERALERVVPELLQAATAAPADLFIGHNLAALPVVVMAARRYRARVGFDAEDFHSGMQHFETPPGVLDQVIDHLERRYLPQCDYLTAASPDIAEAYATRYDIARPHPILNVFPLGMRLAAFQPLSREAPLTLYWFSQTIGARRGLEDVVQAMGRLQDPRLVLHLRGTWQPGYQERLYRFAAAVNVPAAQIVAHAPAPPDAMVRLAAPYAVGLALEQPVSQNRQLCLTNKLFTYLLAGNAVLATATPGQCRFMQGLGKAGWCYAPGDVPALAQGLKRWLTDRSALDTARRQAWDWGTRRYHWELERHRFLQVVHTVLATATPQVA